MDRVILDKNNLSDITYNIFSLIDTAIMSLDKKHLDGLFITKIIIIKDKMVNFISGNEEDKIWPCYLSYPGNYLSNESPETCSIPIKDIEGAEVVIGDYVDDCDKITVNLLDFEEEKTY